MSTTQPPRPPQPAQNTPTRQLLDELDELMQRMLQLPVHQLEEEPAAAATSLVVPTVAPPLPLNNPVTRELPPAAPEIDPPKEPRPAPPAARAIASPPKPTSVSRPARTEEPQPVRPIAATPLLAAAATVAAAPPEMRRPLSFSGTGPTAAGPPTTAQSAWYLQPLLWINHRFDRWTTWLGTPGCWLRSDAGRALLGWAGVLLLTIALAWGLLKWISPG